jgi:hypothetical protein
MISKQLLWMSVEGTGHGLIWGSRPDFLCMYWKKLGKYLLRRDCVMMEVRSKYFWIWIRNSTPTFDTSLVSKGINLHANNKIINNTKSGHSVWKEWNIVASMCKRLITHVRQDDSVLSWNCSEVAMYSVGGTECPNIARSKGDRHYKYMRKCCKTQ